MPDFQMETIHVRFIERNESQMCDTAKEAIEVKETKSEGTPEKPAQPVATKVAASIL